MAEATVTVNHPVGLHARPAATFVKLARTFAASVSITNETRGADPVDAKSMVQVLKAAVGSGHQMTIRAEGSDEDEALAALVALIESNFGE